MQGGAWNFEKEGALTLSRCTFTKNEAYYGGAFSGGQYLSLTVSNASMREHCLFFWYACTFQGPTHVFLGTPVVQVLNSTFTSNNASYGGAVECTTCLDVAMSGLAFQHNTAK